MGDEVADSGSKARRRGRPRVKEARLRTERLCTALTKSEMGAVDAARGSMDRSTWARWVLLRATAGGGGSVVLDEEAEGSWNWDLDTPQR